MADVVTSAAVFEKLVGRFGQLHGVIKLSAGQKSCVGGDGLVLRPGNVHNADGWKGFIDPIVERYLKMEVRLLCRADAAFAKPELYEYLESKGIGYLNS